MNLLNTNKNNIDNNMRRISSKKVFLTYSYCSADLSEILNFFKNKFEVKYGLVDYALVR